MSNEGQKTRWAETHACRCGLGVASPFLSTLSQTHPFLCLSSQRPSQRIRKPGAQEAGNQDIGFLLPPRLIALGKAWPLSVPLSITSTALCGPGSRELHCHCYVFLPQGNPGGDAKRKRNPELPRKVSSDKQGKAQKKGKGPGRGQAMQEPKDFWQSRHPTPGTPTFQQRHRSPPSQGMPVDTAGKSHAPGQSPQTPPALHLRASGQGMECEKYFLENHLLSEKSLDYRLILCISLHDPCPHPRAPSVGNVLLRITPSHPWYFFLRAALTHHHHLCPIGVRFLIINDNGSMNCPS